MYAPGFLRLMHLAGGFRESRILLIANEMDLFSHVSAGTKSAEELAAIMHLNARALSIFMDALVAMGFLHKIGDRYRNTSLSEKYLVVDRPDYRGDILKFMNAHWNHWNNLGEVLKNGAIASNLQSPDPAESSYNQAYIGGMDNMGRERAAKVIQVLDLNAVERMLDVGGGAATYSIAFAKSNPRLTSVVLDLTNPLKVAQENIRRNGMSDQVSTWECSYWEADYKAEYDLVWISQIVHGLSERQSAELVHRSSAALRPGGRLIVHDSLLASNRASPYHAALFAVYMLAITEQGRCYTVEEAKNWLLDAGLKDVCRIELDSESEMVAGIKP
jgi:precorrin-6B methylase 2